MAGEGTKASELYEVAPTVTGPKGVNAADVFRANAANRQKEQAVKRASRQKKFDDLDKSINDLETSGWYKHDETRNSKRDRLRNNLAESYAKYGENAFSGPEGRERYRSIQDGISDLKTFEKYSGQLQKEYTTERGKIKDPDDYTEDSFNNFIEWPSLSFEEQMEAGLPILKHKVDPSNYFNDLQGLSIPYKDYSRESIGSGEREGFLVTKSGKVVKKEELRNIADSYIETGMKGSNKFGLTLYNEKVEELRNSPDGRTLNDTDKDESTGRTELETKAAELASDEAYALLLNRANEEYSTDLAKDPTKTVGAAEEVVEAIPYEGITVTKRGNATTTNETIISQTGGGTKEPKTFLISSPIFIGTNDKVITGNKEGMYFSPIKKFDANVAKEDILINVGTFGIGGLKINKGQIITDSEMIKIKSKGLESKVGKETFIEGVHSTTKQIGSGTFTRQVSDKKTIKIPYTKEVEASLKRHVSSVKKQSKKQKEIESKYDSYKPKQSKSETSIEDEL